jgi:hypothetical protein
MLFSSFSFDNFLSFLVYGLLLFGFSGASVFRAGINVLLPPKAERPPETRHDCLVCAVVPCCKKPSNVLEFAASSSLYDDAIDRAATGYPTARRNCSGLIPRAHEVLGLQSVHSRFLRLEDF